MSKQVNCGGVLIGGGAPISIQSMTNVDTRNEDALLNQITDLANEGCDIVRVAIPNNAAAESFAKVRKKTDVPLVADIHFDYRLALAAIKGGADKVRINPGNIGGMDRVKAVIDAAAERHIPIRVGVNSGSLSRDLIAKYGGVTAEALAESAVRTLNEIEKMGFDDLVLSIKSSDVAMNYKAHIIVREMTDHPLHIGITESGTPRTGKLKSAVGIGALLLAGIGDTIRVSLTEDPIEEVRFAKKILETVGLKRKSIEIVSCPTCGRTEIDLIRLADEVEERLAPIAVECELCGKKQIKVAVMGCAVNGPGEAREADYGIAGGKGEGLIFANGNIVKKVKEDRLIDELISLISGDIGIYMGE